MRPEIRKLFTKTYLTHEEWLILVQYMNNSEILALAARLFYLTNTHSTHSFDFLDPHKKDSEKSNPKVREYLRRAQSLCSLLSKADTPTNFYQIAVGLGPLNLNDQISFIDHKI